jgi:hypothetical protein
MVTIFLLKKITNPTPYSPILYFGKENNPLCNHAHSSFIILTWSCQKPLTTLSHSNTPNITLKNWDYSTWLCRYGSHAPLFLNYWSHTLCTIFERLHVGMSISFFEKIYARKNNCLLCYFKMIGIVDVNFSRRWGERRYVCEGWKQYMYHKSSTLFHTKMPKTELIFQLLKFSFINCPRRIPLIANCYIPNICQINGIFEFIAQCLMFVSQLWIDLLFCISIH